MKKALSISILLFFAVIGIQAFNRGDDTRLHLPTGGVAIREMGNAAKNLSGKNDFSLAPEEREQSRPAGEFASRLGDPIQSATVTSRNNNGCRILAARLLELLPGLSRLSPDPGQHCYFTRITDLTPRILLWLAASVEVRAGPLAA